MRAICRRRADLAREGFLQRRVWSSSSCQARGPESSLFCDGVDCEGCVIGMITFEGEGEDGTHARAGDLLERG